MAQHPSDEPYSALVERAFLPLPDLMDNFGLLMGEWVTAHILFVSDMYRRILDVPGTVMEFGTRRGQNIALFQQFRRIWEPYNDGRHIIGFDTWTGFPHVNKRDGNGVAAGDLSSPPGYADDLAALLRHKQRLGSMPNGPAPELVRGDVVETVPAYLLAHPETVVALAYFDLDLYAGTKACLEAILPRMPKGAMLVFDELSHPQYPGETIAVLEMLRLNGLRLQRLPFNTYQCFAQIGG